MQNDFEKDIAQRMQDFRIAPQPEIWQQVEAALPPEKKRRRMAFWWWLLPLVVLLGGGIWLAIDKQPNNVSIKKIIIPQTTSSKSDLSKKTQAENPVDAPGQKLSSTTTAPLQKNEKKNNQLRKNDSIQNIKTITSTENELSEIASSVSNARQKQSSYRINKSSRKFKQIIINPSIVKVENKLANPQSDTSSDELEEVVRTNVEINPLAKSDVDITKQIKDTMPVSSAQPKIATDSTASIKPIADTAKISPNTVTSSKKVSNKKSRSTWIVEGGLGQSWQRQSLPKYNGLYYSSPQNATGPVTSLPVNYSSFIPPKASFSFSAGITQKQAISKHWNWQLALHYQLLSSTQDYGSKRDSLPNNYALDAARISSVYFPGDTMTYHNYVHQVQLAPGIEYIINPASHSPISINTRFSLAYNFSSNQLLVDNRTHNYVRSSAFSTKWLYAVEIGAGIFIHKKIYAGLTYQHGLSNVARPALQSDYRWRQWQVRLGLPLFNHSSK